MARRLSKRVKLAEWQISRIGKVGRYIGTVQAVAACGWVARFPSARKPVSTMRLKVISENFYRPARVFRALGKRKEPNTTWCWVRVRGGDRALQPGRETSTGGMGVVKPNASQCESRCR